MKTAISIPSTIFKAADRLAKRMRVSRSRLYSSAISRFVVEHERKNITDQLNKVYADIEPEPHIPSDLQIMQSLSLDNEKW